MCSVHPSFPSRSLYFSEVKVDNIFLISCLNNKAFFLCTGLTELFSMILTAIRFFFSVLLFVYFLFFKRQFLCGTALAVQELTL